MAKLLLVKFFHRVIQLLKKIEAGGCYASLDNSAVIRLAFASDQPAFFHAIEKPGHVWIARDHAVADALAGKAVRARAAQDAEDVVLGGGKTKGFYKKLSVLREAIGGAHQSDEQLSLGSRQFRNFCGAHI